MEGRVDLAGKTIGIVGLGQIGGSMAAALTVRSEAIVVGCDIDAALETAARERGIVTETMALDNLVGRADVLVLAIPHETTLELLRDKADRIRSKELVVDTCSLKARVCTLADGLRLASFVGCHPLAGTEKKAPEAWHADLFTGSPSLCCLTEHTSPSARGSAAQLVRAFGSTVTEIDSETHDRLFALTSGLPHAVAVALYRLFDAEAAGQKMALAGPSFRSATRVASSDPALIKHLLYDNRTNVAGRLDKLIAILSQFRDALRDDDHERFDSLLKD